jgi:hypothetical protein
MQRCNVSSKLEETTPKDLSNPASMMNGNLRGGADEARSAIVDFLFLIFYLKTVPELVERVIFDLRTVPELVERVIFDLKTGAIAREIIAPEGRYRNSPDRAVLLKAPEGRHGIVSFYFGI